jgi:hypothetical protein
VEAMGVEPMSAIPFILGTTRVVFVNTYAAAKTQLIRMMVKYTNMRYITINSLRIRVCYCMTSIIIHTDIYNRLGRNYLIITHMQQLHHKRQFGFPQMRGKVHHL